MKNTDILYSFAARCILTETALDSTQRIKKSKITNEEFKKLHESLGINGLEDELVKQAQKMAIVYTAISAFENAVRKFVSKKLLEVYGEKWWDKVPPGIRTKAQTRKEKEEKIRWHTARGDENINYTEFGDLITIMRLNWNDFEPHIISLEWADNIIKSIELSRNVIMHSGELSNQDIERIGTFIRDWTNQVG